MSQSSVARTHVERALERAKNQGGMQVGLPQATLDASVLERLIQENDDLTIKVQFLVDYLRPLEDGGFTFPDGSFWPETAAKEKT